MKVLVMSDSHGSPDSIRRVLDANPAVNTVIFLGDGLRDWGGIEPDYPRLQLYCVAGNCDFSSLYPNEGLLAFDGVTVLYTHGHLYQVKSTTERLRAAAALRGAQVALYGHTHTAAVQTRGGVLLANPGSVNRFGIATYGILEITDGEPSFTICTVP